MALTLAVGTGFTVSSYNVKGIYEGSSECTLVKIRPESRSVPICSFTLYFRGPVQRTWITPRTAVSLIHILFQLTQMCSGSSAASVRHPPLLVLGRCNRLRCADCPVNTGLVTLNGNLTLSSLPWFPPGDFEIKVTAVDGSMTEIFCLDVQLTL